jgi:RHS repeat-associated protein
MRKDCGADCGARFGGRGEIDNNEVRASGVTTTYSYAASGFTPTQFNQLARYTDGTKTVSFTYDRSGNRLTRTAGGQTDTYAYDAENRLVTLTKSTTDTGTPGTYRYAYDYRTRRVERAETIAGTTSTTAIVFSGGTSVQEYTGAVSTTSLAVQYVRGSDWGGGVGGLLYSVRGGTPSFKHYDARGDVIAESNATGASTWRAQYDAYGTRGQESGTPSADRQRGNTKDEDPSGLRNDGFRYYDLDAQIYLTADPAGFVDGPNVYCYVVQNPWSKFDPEGLTAWWNIGGHIADYLTIPAANFVVDTINGVSGGWQTAQRAEAAQNSINADPQIVANLRRDAFAQGLPAAANVSLLVPGTTVTGPVSLPSRIGVTPSFLRPAATPAGSAIAKTEIVAAVNAEAKATTAITTPGGQSAQAVTRTVAMTQVSQRGQPNMRKGSKPMIRMAP